MTFRAVSRSRIDAHGAFDHRAALDTLAAHQIEGLDRLDREQAALTRLITVGGELVPVTVTLDAAGATVSTPTGDPGVNEAVTAQVAQWFDLATDLTPIVRTLGADPVFAPLLAARPGVRLTRFAAPFEAVIRTILGQQVSLTAGRLFGARLVAAYGRPAARTGLRGFPTAQRIAAEPVDDLRARIGLTRARARTIHESATLFTGHDDSDRDDAGHDDDDHVDTVVVLPPRQRLARVYGIGAWTLDYLAIRAAGDADAFPASDAVLRRILRTLTDTDPAEASRAWSPYRSYAAAHLWAATSGS